MKHLRRYFCVLLCFVLLLGVFSVNVSAVDLDVKPYHIFSGAYFNYGDNGGNHHFGSQTFYPNNSTIEKSEHHFVIDNNSISDNSFAYYYSSIATDDGTMLFEKGKKAIIRLENFYIKYLLSCSDHNGEGRPFYYEYFAEPYTVAIEFIYRDGTSIIFNPDVSNNDYNYSLITSLDPKDDVVKMNVLCFTRIPYHAHLNHTFGITAYLGEWDGDNKFNLTIEQSSEEAGLLQGILGSLGDGFKNLGDKLSGVWSAITDGFTNMGNKLTNVWTAITDGFSNMGQKLTDVFNSIVELPGKLWGLIENGLKSLFVPDEQTIADYKGKFETLFESKLGAVWQVVDITLESWDNINSSNITDTITIPEVIIPLPANESFSFGGQSVKVVPDGFQFLADLCKTASAMFCTLMFINGLRKRYDEVMGVEQ